MLNVLTGAAASRVGPDGLLQLDTPTSGNRPEIPEARARVLAIAAAHTFGPLQRPALEQDRGGPIAFERLTDCGRAFYAASPVEALPAEVPAVYHRTYGPYWLIALCDGAGPQQLSVAVSAYATHVEVGADGQPVYRGPSPFGEEFRMLGVPTYLGALPTPPEEAAVLASRAAGGRKVAGVGQLVVPLPSVGYPQVARWRFALETPASVHAAFSGATRSVGELFVGINKFRDGPQVHAAATRQPATLRFSWYPPAPANATMDEVQAVKPVPAQARIRADVVTNFERVTAVTGGTP